MLIKYEVTTVSIVNIVRMPLLELTLKAVVNKICTNAIKSPEIAQPIKNSDIDKELVIATGYTVAVDRVNTIDR